LRKGASVESGPFLQQTDSGGIGLQGTVNLQPNARRILQLLVGRAGYLVSFQEIRHALGGRHAAANRGPSLESYVRQIRAALGEAGQAAVQVETVRGRGYRLVGLQEHAAAGGEPGVTQPRPVGLPRRVRDRSARERALVLAAASLFASRGFAETTTAEIAAAAGCAEGLIHRYFQGKAGLLLAIVRLHFSDEASELTRLPLKPTIEEEYVQLVAWETERMWQRRESLKVVVRQGLVDASVAAEMIKNGPNRRAPLIAERLRSYSEGRSMAPNHLQQVACSVSALALMFGFLRPSLGENHYVEKQTALGIATMIGGALCGPADEEASFLSAASSPAGRRM
jgi:AcrR family transcriptional regulator/DNA-binding winged helix-turn-helix (wHTH) protein